MSASTDATLRVWELQSGRELHCLKGDGSRVTSIVLNSNGRWAISRLKDGYLDIWDLEEGLKLYSLKRSALSLAISPDGQLAALTSGRSMELVRNEIRTYDSYLHLRRGDAMLRVHQ